MYYEVLESSSGWENKIWDQNILEESKFNSVGEEYEVIFPRSRGSGLGFYYVGEWMQKFYEPGKQVELDRDTI